MKFSVAICTYNGEKYITDQLESIFAQTHSVSEIIICDDGSRDQTLSIIQKFKASHTSANAPSIYVYQNPTSLGIAKNFEKCISLTKNEWVFLSDQDDVWYANKVEIFLEEIYKYPEADFFCSNAELTNGEGRPLGYSLFEALEVKPKELSEINSEGAFEVLLRRNLATGATALLNKRAFNNSTPFPDGWLHDEWLAITSASRGSFRVIDLKTIEYRQHGGNSVGAKKLTLRNKISKFREPRNERNTNLQQRAEFLHSWLGLHNFGNLSSSSIDAKEISGRFLDFHNHRLNYPNRRFLRIVPATKELLKSNYANFALGFKDFLRDLSQPEGKHTANFQD